MSGKKNRKGFTLIEMLIVIAIIAVLVAVVIPVMGNSSAKAKAATDAANLRAVLATLNIHVLNGTSTVEEIIADAEHPISKMDPDATLRVVYNAPGFIDVYYVNGSTYYGLDYLTEVASEGTSNLSTAQPSVPNGSVWYTVTGEITD